MTISHEFNYFKPKTIKKTLAFLKQYGEKARILAGGTDLINFLNEDIITPEVVIDVKGLKGLNKLKISNEKLHIGALVTFNDILGSKVIKKFPIFLEMAKRVASHGIRNRATLVGNICSAVPCCDTGPVLLIYDAEIVVNSSHGQKHIPIHSWFLGPKKTILKPGEFVSEIIVPLPKEKNAGCFVKLGRYNGEDLAQASVAILNISGKVNLAFGSVGPTPIRSAILEEILKQQNEFSQDALQQVYEKLPHIISPITDIRASKEYRMHMVQVMLERGLKASFERLHGKGPAYGTSLI